MIRLKWERRGDEAYAATFSSGMMMLTVAKFTSGWRYDVFSGIGVKLSDEAIPFITAEEAMIEAESCARAALYDALGEVGLES